MQELINFLGCLVLTFLVLAIPILTGYFLAINAPFILIYIFGLISIVEAVWFLFILIKSLKDKKGIVIKK